MLDDHSRLTIDEYLVQATKMEVRTCTEHENQPLTMGCKVCHTVVCMKGLAGLDKCTNGNCVKMKIVTVLVDLNIRCIVGSNNEEHFL